MVYLIQISGRAKKDIDKLTPKNKQKLKDILVNLIAQDPYVGKKLIGDLSEYYSYRLNYQDRIVYSIDTNKNIIYVHRAKTHYGD